MKKNLYIELRKWVSFWGLGFDSQKEIQKLLNEYNAKGWQCVHFEKIKPNLSFDSTIFVSIVFIITFGFLQKWGGCAIVFERDDDISNHTVQDRKHSAVKTSSAPAGSKLEEWRKRNPHKSINDFYRENS